MTRLAAAPDHLRVARTHRSATEVLTDIAALDLGNSVVSERGLSYVVIASSGRRPGGPGMAVGLFAVTVLAVLVLTAFDVRYVALLPLSLLPLLLLLLSRRSFLAVAALAGAEGTTVVTVSGTGSTRLLRTVDRYLDRESAAAPTEAGLAAEGQPENGPPAEAEAEAPAADPPPTGPTATERPSAGGRCARSDDAGPDVAPGERPA